MIGKIYIAINNINNKVYIGQTIRTLKNRRQGHYDSMKRIGTKSYFTNALIKYGINNFKWKIIDIVYNQKSLDTREKYWIKFYQATDSKYGYNLLSGGGSGRTPNKELRKKLSLANKNQNNRKGCKWSAESKLQLSIKNKKRYNKLPTEKKQKQVQALIDYRKQHPPIMSEKHKKIISAAVSISNRTRVCSEETKLKHAKTLIKTKKQDPNFNSKISAGLRQYWANIENRKKQSIAMTEKKASNKTIEKLRSSHLGHIVPYEIRQKISITLKNKHRQK